MAVTEQSPGSGARTLGARSLTIGAVVALLVLLLGVAVVLRLPTTYRAEGSLVVLPLPETSSAGYFRALADGEAVAEFATTVTTAADEVGGDEASVQVVVAPATSAITVSATASTGEEAAAAVGRVVTASTTGPDAVRPPFALVAAGPVPDGATLPPQPDGKVARIMIVVGIAALAGLATQQIVWLSASVGLRRAARGGRSGGAG
ncbi:hypothetical protein [Actinomycetospora aeridis]|uniref:Capsular polysaccharide biosynthesis protein n=1 Tax=Actinomycetospora aeridis TaxID=3129231 RepID=A0ABU8N6N3_9PSEU